MSLRSLPAIVWTLLIVALCLVPSSWLGSGEPSGDPSWLRRLLGPIPLDKAIHFSMFAIFGLIWRWSGASLRSTLLGGVALAVLTELGQSIPALERSTDLDDLMADLAGLAVPLLLYRPTARRVSEPIANS